MEKNALEWIDKLALIKHKEGGYYREIYRSEKKVGKYINSYHLATSIYYLLEGNDYSAFHKINGDEIWHFLYGSSITIYILDEKTSKLTKVILGRDIDRNESLTTIIYKGCWFAAEVNNKLSYTLIGCTVIPGFEFRSFTLAKKKILLSKFPKYRKVIEKLTCN